MAKVTGFLINFQNFEFEIYVRKVLNTQWKISDKQLNCIFKWYPPSIKTLLSPMHRIRIVCYVILKCENNHLRVYHFELCVAEVVLKLKSERN